MFKDRIGGERLWPPNSRFLKMKLLLKLKVVVLAILIPNIHERIPIGFMNLLLFFSFKEIHENFTPCTDSLDGTR